MKEKEKIQGQVNKVKTNIKQLSKKVFTARLLFFILAIGTLFVLIFKQYIFPPDSYIVQIYSDGYEDDLLSLLVKLGVILVIIFGFTSLARIFILRSKDPELDPKRKTWLSLFGNVCKYISIIAGLILILALFGVDTKALLAGAGVLTLIVGLGCQSLVADIVAGLFIMFEGNIQIGDIVVVDGFRGEIISIGIRTTNIKNDYGNIKIINNSNIKDLVNNSRELSLVINNIGFDYGIPYDKVAEAIESNLDRIRQNVPAIVEGPYFKGLKTFKSSEILVMLTSYCKESDIYGVERDIYRELYYIFKENNIAMAFDQVTVSYRDKVNDYIDEKQKEQENQDK